MTRGPSWTMVNSSASISRSVTSTSFVLVRYRSYRWAMMSVMPQAVWKGGRVWVSAGFRMENFGRMASPEAPRLYMPFSLVMTESGLPSLPAAAMVNIVPTGRAFSIYLPQ